MQIKNGHKEYTNSVHVEGYVYDHKLESRVTGPKSKNPGTPFIMGDLSVATDEEMLNVVRIHFSYATPVTAKGKPNNTYNVLQSIIDGKIGNAMEHGKENAGKVRIDTTIGLNEWPNDDGTMVCVKRNEGGFVHQVTELNPDESKRSTFNADMVITGATRYEADEERGIPERVVVKGCVFDFRGAMLPVDFSVYEPYAPAAALDYFESLDASSSNPIFTRVQGVEISKTVVRKTTEESAFGAPIVKETRSSQRDFVINWAQPELYAWDDESTLLASEFSQKIQDRELHLAEVRKRREDYLANRDNVSAFTTTTTTEASTAKKVYDF